MKWLAEFISGFIQIILGKLKSTTLLVVTLYAILGALVFVIFITVRQLSANDKVRDVNCAQLVVDVRNLKRQLDSVQTNCGDAIDQVRRQANMRVIAEDEKNDSLCRVISDLNTQIVFNQREIGILMKLISSK